MALPVSGLNSYTLEYIASKSFNVVFHKSPLFARARTKNNLRFDGGRFIQQPIVPFKLIGSSFGRFSSLSTTYVNTDAAYQVNIKFYYVSVVLAGTDGALNQGDLAIMSMVELKMANASAMMGELLATDMYLSGLSNANVIANLGQDSDTLSLDGFAQWIDDGTNVTTVGGITRTDIGTTGVVGGGNGYFQNVGGKITKPILNNAIAACEEVPDRVDLLVGNRATWMYIHNLLQPDQRYLREDTDLAKAGFQAIQYIGADLAKDPYCPAGALLGMTSEYFMFYTSSNPLFMFGFTGFKEGQGTIDYVGQMLWAGNMLYPAPRSGMYLVSITGS